jgi:hypothetical protein
MAKINNPAMVTFPSLSRISVFFRREIFSARHLAMTIHGPGYGLDEVEALMAQFKGYLQAIKYGKIPQDIERISIVKRSPPRVKRLRPGFEKNIDGMKNVSKVKNR